MIQTFLGISINMFVYTGLSVFLEKDIGSSEQLLTIQNPFWLISHYWNPTVYRGSIFTKLKTLINC